MYRECPIIFTRREIMIVLGCVAGAARLAFAQTPLGSQFTYQGRLQAAGMPAVGTADFRFALFDAVSGGTQIGTTQTSSNIAVVGGVFTLPIDFGVSAFNGDARWIEVAVRSPAGSGGFTTLAPRQPLSATPYALQTRGLFVDSSNRIGVGTTTPSKPVHIRQTDPVLILQDSDGNVTQSGYLGFWNNNGTETGWVGFGTPSSPHFSVRNSRTGGSIQLQPGPGGVVSVPILEITGADIAEKFPTSETLVPGMVVAIDAKNPGKLCQARGAYNRCVAGVVSGANDFPAGAVLGSAPESKGAPAIALSGRVYVMCDTTEAAIEPGDLLTSSNVPGHAMKAVDRERSHGAVIGKAMTGLAKGESGLVLVLVNLQ